MRTASSLYSLPSKVGQKKSASAVMANGDYITADVFGVTVNGVLQTAERFSAYIETEFPNAGYDR